MSHIQWQMEALTLQKLEERKVEYDKMLLNTFKAGMKETLIDVFGLSIGQPANTFLPLVFWCGHPELLKKAAGGDTAANDESHDETEMGAGGTDPNSPANSKELDELNRHLMKLEWAEVVPLFREQTNPHRLWGTDAYDRAAGVTIISSDGSDDDVF